jgi:hypothetical protein
MANDEADYNFGGTPAGEEMPGVSAFWRDDTGEVFIKTARKALSRASVRASSSRSTAGTRTLRFAVGFHDDEDQYSRRNRRIGMFPIGLREATIRVGYEVAYKTPQPTAMVLTLPVYPSRADDLVTPDPIVTTPPIAITEFISSQPLRPLFEG